MPAEGNPVAIAGVTVIDVASGSRLPDQTVILRYGRIDAIEPTAEYGEIPGWMQRIDGTDRFLIPGLWDAHVHLSFWNEPSAPARQDPDRLVENDYEEVLSRLTAWGVTSVRDMGGDLEAIDVWRNRVKRGETIGPTVYRAGPYVDGPKPNDKYRLFVTNPEEARSAVQQLRNRGVDFLKVHSQVPPHALVALAREAKAEGLRFAGHVPAGTSVDELVELGVSTIEHADAWFISRLGSRSGKFDQWKAAYDWHSTPAGQRMFEGMAAAQVYFTPTLRIFDSDWSRVGEPWSALRTWYRNLAGLAHQNGVRFLAGTDLARKTGPVQPGVGLHEELQHLVQVGLAPWEALRAATLDPARALGQDETTGSISTGKVADLVLLRSDPLLTIRATRDIDLVVVRGRALRIERLQTLRGER